MSSIYHEVIDVLTTQEDTINYRAIVISLAKRHPDIFLELYGKENYDPRAKTIYEFIVAGETIEAIKVLREATKGGLKETKDIVFKIRDCIGMGSVIVITDENPLIHPFYGESKKFVHQLIQYANSVRGF